MASFRVDVDHRRLVLTHFETQSAVISRGVSAQI